MDLEFWIIDLKYAIVKQIEEHNKIQLLLLLLQYNRTSKLEYMLPPATRLLEAYPLCNNKTLYNQKKFAAIIRYVYISAAVLIYKLTFDICKKLYYTIMGQNRKCGEDRMVYHYTYCNFIFILQLRISFSICPHPSSIPPLNFILQTHPLGII